VAALERPPPSAPAHFDGFEALRLAQSTARPCAIGAPAAAQQLTPPPVLLPPPPPPLGTAALAARLGARVRVAAHAPPSPPQPPAPPHPTPVLLAPPPPLRTPPYYLYAHDEPGGGVARRQLPPSTTPHPAAAAGAAMCLHVVAADAAGAGGGTRLHAAARRGAPADLTLLDALHRSAASGTPQRVGAGDGAVEVRSTQGGYNGGNSWEDCQEIVLKPDGGVTLKACHLCMKQLTSKPLAL
jgi:hypothetical protein